MRLRRPQPPTDQPLPWRRWADGRVWQLKGGRDYHVSTRVLQEAAKEVGQRLDMAVRMAVEESTRRGKVESSLWLQFVDAEVRVGEPCICGATELVRPHPTFARCPNCGAHLSLRQPRESVDLSHHSHLLVLEADDDRGEPVTTEELEEAEAIAGAAQAALEAAGARDRERRERKQRRALQREEKRRRKRDERAAHERDRRELLRWQPEERRRHRSPAEAVGGERSELRERKGAHRSEVRDHLEAWREALRAAGAPEAPNPIPEDDRWALTEYQQVVFMASAGHEARATYFGRGVDPEGAAVLLIVDCALDDGGPLLDAPGERPEQAAIRRWPLAAVPEAVVPEAMDSADAVPAPLPALRPYKPSSVERRRHLSQPVDLAGWRDVRLAHRELLAGRERRYGSGVNPTGERELLYVDYPLMDGRPIADPAGEGRELHVVFRWPAEPFGRALDPERA